MLVLVSDRHWALSDDRLPCREAGEEVGADFAEASSCRGSSREYLSPGDGLFEEHVAVGGIEVGKVW